jgi:selenide,water dikinase
MARPSGVDVELHLGAIPFLDGALDTVRLGILSSLQPQNVRLRRAIRDLAAFVQDERLPLIFDPQTAGGLLASIPAGRADACLAVLKRLGYGNAAIVGTVRPQSDQSEPVVLC